MNEVKPTVKVNTNSSIDIWLDMSLPIVEADPILFFSSIDVDYDGGES